MTKLRMLQTAFENNEYQIRILANTNDYSFYLMPNERLGNILRRSQHVLTILFTTAFINMA